MKEKSSALKLLLAVAALASVSACGDSSPAPAPVVAEETRSQDSRTSFAASATTKAATTFAAMAAATGDVVDMSTTSRWAGILGVAAYQVEVPKDWNGKLVMYAHGFAGNGDTLGVGPPSIRRYLVQNGYAWASSSYSKNYYDVKAGVEDTNALALEFNKIATANNRTLATPTKYFITGHSMGGHITGAAIDDEATANAKNKVKYNGAVPMCGVMGDTELFNTFAAMQVSAQYFAGPPNAHYDTRFFAEIKTAVDTALFTTFPSVQTPVGVKYKSVVKNLTGGERPMFELGMSNGGSFPSAYGTFGSDGTVTGILNKTMLDTNAITYTIDGDTAGSTAMNAGVLKLTGQADANRLRTDGLRWIPKVNGNFKIPVVSIHTLGDLFVPFNMEQVFQKRVAAQGNSNFLVQRAIRGISHCDFTIAEQVKAFDDMQKWEAGGAKPAGDDVVTAATVAAPKYGCTHTIDTIGPDDGGTVKALRPLIAASPTTTACTAP